jgi:integrase
VKLNSQTLAILERQEPLWNYRKDYISHKFKKELRRLGIRNARFHDLRRTFGLNLIKQGMSIYKVSKLLGHNSVRTTEQHYAPLLTVESFYPLEFMEEPVIKIRLKKNNRIARSGVAQLRPV